MFEKIMNKIDDLYSDLQIKMYESNNSDLNLENFNEDFDDWAKISATYATGGYFQK